MEFTFFEITKLLKYTTHFLGDILSIVFCFESDKLEFSELYLKWELQLE